MFAYCGNSPINRTDSSGDFWHIIGGAVLGAIAGTVTKMVTNVISGKDLTDDLVTAGIAGAVSGGLAASGVGIIGQVVGNAVIGASNNVVDQLNAGTTIDNLDVGSTLVDGAIGAIAGFAGGAGAGSRSLTQLGVTNIKRAGNALLNKGIKAAADTLGKGLTYFAKNAKHMIKPLSEAVAKSSVSVVINNTAKVLLG